MSTRVGMLVLAAVVALALFTGSASAEGGSSIAAGPQVVYGQQEFGNTASGPHLSDPHGWDQFWSLSVVSGDKLTIDWESAPSSGTRLLLYPVGTTDYTIDQNETLSHQGENSEGKNELHYTVSATGLLPLIINTSGREGTTYNFIAYVQHAVSVALPRFSTLKHRKTVVAQAHTPEGGVITDPGLSVTLEAKGRQGSWKKLGSASVSNSAAAIPARVPKSLWHQRVSVRVTATGAAYLTTRSRISHVQVP